MSSLSRGTSGIYSCGVPYDAYGTTLEICTVSAVYTIGTTARHDYVAITEHYGHRTVTTVTFAEFLIYSVRFALDIDFEPVRLG